MPDLKAFYNDKLLSELAVGYGNGKFIADKAMPIVYSPDKSGQFQTFDDSNYVMDQVGELASPYSDVQFIDFGVAKSDYDCQGRSWKHSIPLIEDEDTLGQHYQGAVQAIMGTLLRSREKNALGKILACGNTATITTKWDAASTDWGTVVVGIGALKKKVRDAVGEDPDTLIVGADVWDVMEAKWAVNFGTAGITPTPEAIAAKLGLKQVLVSRNSYKTAKLGTPVPMWTVKYAGMLISGDSQPGPAGEEGNYFTPSFGKLVYWKKAGVNNGVEWDQYFDRTKGTHGCNIVQGTLYYDAVETLNDAAAIGAVLT